MTQITHATGTTESTKKKKEERVRSFSSVYERNADAQRACEASWVVTEQIPETPESQKVRFTIETTATQETEKRIDSSAGQTWKGSMTRRNKIQRGYAFKKSGSWFLRYADSILEDGKLVRKQCCTKLAPVCDEYRSKKALSTLIAKILSPINSGEIDPQSTIKIEDFITTRYLPQVKEKLRRSTYKNYKDIFEIHVQPRLDGRSLRKFRTVDAERLLSDVGRQAKTKEGLPLSHSSLERVKAFLSGVFKCAKRLGAFDGQNPIQDTSIPKTGIAPKQTHAYSHDEIKKIIGILGERTRKNGLRSYGAHWLTKGRS